MLTRPPEPGCLVVKDSIDSEYHYRLPVLDEEEEDSHEIFSRQQTRDTRPEFCGDEFILAIE